MQSCPSPCTWIEFVYTSTGHQVRDNHSLFEKEVRKSMGSADRVPSSLKAIPRADGKLRPLASQSSMMFLDGVGSAASPVASSAAQERVRMMASANVCSRCDGCSIVGIHDHFRGLTFVAVNTITHESQDQLHRFLEGLQPKHSSQVEPGGFGLRRCGKQISTGA